MSSNQNDAEAWAEDRAGEATPPVKAQAAA